MFLHLSVSHSVHRERGCLADTPWADTPRQTAPGQTPPGTHTPQQTPPGQTPPWADTPQADPWADTPPPAPQTATAADGTHPTGVHSCFFLS